MVSTKIGIHHPELLTWFIMYDKACLKPGADDKAKKNEIGYFIHMPNLYNIKFE